MVVREFIKVFVVFFLTNHYAVTTLKCVSSLFLVCRNELLEAGPFTIDRKTPISADFADFVHFRVMGRNAEGFWQVNGGAVKYKLSQNWVWWGRLTVDYFHREVGPGPQRSGAQDSSSISQLQFNPSL